MLFFMSKIAKIITTHNTIPPSMVVMGFIDTLILPILNWIFEHLKEKDPVEIKVISSIGLFISPKRAQ